MSFILVYHIHDISWHVNFNSTSLLSLRCMHTTNSYKECMPDRSVRDWWRHRTGCLVYTDRTETVLSLYQVSWRASRSFYYWFVSYHEPKTCADLSYANSFFRFVSSEWNFCTLELLFILCCNRLITSICIQSHICIITSFVLASRSE